MCHKKFIAPIKRQDMLTYFLWTSYVHESTISSFQRCLLYLMANDLTEKDFSISLFLLSDEMRHYLPLFYYRRQYFLFLSFSTRDEIFVEYIKNKVWIKKAVKMTLQQEERCASVSKGKIFSVSFLEKIKLKIEIKQRSIFTA
jgi:hypothetical protein